MTRKTPRDLVPPPLTRLSYAHAAATLQISLPTLYRRIAAGKLTPVRDGRRAYIAMDELRRYAAGGAA